MPTFHFQINVHHFLLLLLLIISFFIRVINIQQQYPVDLDPINIPPPDVFRDYLVAHHILRYQEYPNFGPYAMAFYNSPLRHSHLYYYLLALFLVIKDEMVFLGWINIYLQVISIVLIYLIVKRLFSVNTALITSLLFGLSNVGIKQSLFIAQTNLALSLLILSVFLLIQFHQKEKYFLIILSIFFMVFAASIHFSFFGVIPLFIFLVFIVLRKQRAKTYQYLLTYALLPIFFSLFFYPTLNNFLKHQNVFSLVNKPIFVSSPTALVNNFSISFSTFMTNIFPPTGRGLYSWENLLLLVITITAIAYFYSKKVELSAKYWTLSIFGGIVLFVFLSSLVNYYNSKIYSYYFLPVIWLVFILVSEIINAVFTGNRILTLIKLLIIFFMLRLFSYNFDLLLKKPLQNNLNLVTNAIKKEIIGVKEKDKLTEINFFQIRMYWGGQNISGFDTIFWVQLEKDFNKKFTKVIDGSENIWSTNDEKYIFLVCVPRKEDYSWENNCLASFSKNMAKYDLNYEVLQKIYSEKPYFIYLTKRADK